MTRFSIRSRLFSPILTNTLRNPFHSQIKTPRRDLSGTYDEDQTVMPHDSHYGEATHRSLNIAKIYNTSSGTTLMTPVNCKSFFIVFF